MKRLLYLLPAVFLLCSCIKVVVVGRNTDYDKLTDEQKAHVVPTSAPIDSLTYDGNIYVVSIEQVKDFIATHDTAEVFFWVAPCSSETCDTPQMLEDAAMVHHAAPCIIVSSFYWDRMPAVGSLKAPLLFVDVRKYGTDIVYKYSRAIRKDLTGLDYDNPDDRAVLKKNRSLLFHHGQFVPQEEEEE